MVDEFGCRKKKLDAQYGKLAASSKYFNKVPNSLHGLIAVKCGHMYDQMLAEKKQDMEGTDVFLEQMYACGAYGFKEFFRAEWLKRVMAEQDAEYGCFKLKGRKSPW